MKNAITVANAMELRRVVSGGQCAEVMIRPYESPLESLVESRLLQVVEDVKKPKLAFVVQMDTSSEHDACRCVDAILSQTLEGVVAILMDVGASVEVSELCDSYAEFHKNVIVVHEREPLSLGVGMNAGLRIAQGMGAEFVSFVTPMSQMDMRAANNMVKKLQATGADVACCGIQLHNTETLKRDEKFWNLLEPFYGDSKVDQKFGGVFGELGNTTILDLVREAPDTVFSLEDYPALLMSLLCSDAFVFRVEFLLENGVRWQETDEILSQIPFLVDALTATERIVAVKRYLLRVECDGKCRTSWTPVLQRHPLLLAKACWAALDILTEKRGHMDDLGKLGYVMAAFIAVKNQVAYMSALELIGEEHTRQLVRMCEDGLLPKWAEFAEYSRWLGKLFRRLDDGDTLLDHANEFLNENDVAFIEPFLPKW